MPSTAHTNVINLQVLAEDQVAIDRANGTYDANRASDSKYYFWHSEFQTIPVGMDGQPEQFAQQLRAALPQVTTLRLPFNEHSFNPDGSLHEQYERFLHAAAAEGFELLFVYCGGDVQRAGNDIASADALYEALDGEIFDAMSSGWDTMLSWLDANSDVQDALYGLEIANEPESYSVGGDRDGAGSTRFHELYASHVIELAARIDAAIDAKILVGGWRYSARFDELATGDVDGQSVIDAIRSAIGDDLVWSAHLYPGWSGADGDTAEALEASFGAHFAAVIDDAVLVTETNAPGSVVDNVDARDAAAYLFARSYEWFAQNGIGLGWFPGAETGASNFVVIDWNGTLRFLHQSSLAHGMNAFSLDENPAEHAIGQALTTDLVVGRVRNEAYQPKGIAFDDTDGIAYGFGYGGDDTITGRDTANDLIYGGTGHDMLTGGSNDDHLFGQGGNDTLHGGTGDDHLLGGDGDDVLSAGSGLDQLTGGAGADTFVPGGGHTDIVDFDWSQGDRLMSGAGAQGLWDMLSGITLDGADGHLQIDGGTVILYDFMSRNAAAIADTLFGQDAADRKIVAGSGSADVIDTAYRDPEGDGPSDGADVVIAGDGDDSVVAGNGDDSLLGGNGNDTLSGGDGSDVIVGGAGNDVLDGGAGNDLLVADSTDASGHEVFQFEPIPAAEPSSASPSTPAEVLDQTAADMQDSFGSGEAPVPDAGLFL